MLLQDTVLRASDRAFVLVPQSLTAACCAHHSTQHGGALPTSATPAAAVGTATETPAEAGMLVDVDAAEVQQRRGKGAGPDSRWTAAAALAVTASAAMLQ